MRITALAMYKFNPFLFNDIALLEMELTHDVQNIIGSNGAGKSSLLRELNPRPATRTDFGESGYKRIQLVHAGIEYRLESNFANLSKPHSFIRDNEELNPSGTSNIQEELVRQELGYTPQVHNLCYGEQRLSSIRVGMREIYLLTIHPCQMKLLLDNHKTIERRLRSFRNNMSLLIERRTALTTQMLEPTLLLSLQNENTKLTHELALVIGSIHKLSNERRNIISGLSKQHGATTVRSKDELLTAQRRYPLYRHILRDIPIEEQRTVISGEIGSCKSQLEDSLRRIRALTIEIDKYAQHIRQNDAQAAIDVIEETLRVLQNDIDALRNDVLEQPFDLFHLEEVPTHVSYLADMLAPFIGYNAPIPAMSTVHRMQLKYDYNTRQLAECERNESILIDKLQVIEAHLREQVLDTISDGCHGCVLFQQYSTTIRRLQTEYDTISTELRLLQKRKTRLCQLVDGRRSRLASYQQILPQMQRLEQYLNTHRFLFIPLQDLELLTVLRQNPSVLLVRLQSHYERSRNHYLRLKKQEELSRRTADYERLKTPSTFSQQFLETLIVEKQTEMEAIRHTYHCLDTTLTQKEELLTQLSNYTQELHYLEQDQAAYTQQECIATLTFERDLCERYLSILESCKSKGVSRLSEIDRVLREQDGLIAARQEILTNITRIETQQRDFSEMERALSPSSGIPYRYMVQFINELISIANPFIAEVFSYPFEFIPLEEGSPLDYKFRMRVGDVIVPDISRCSEAQKDFADLAFRLAQIIELRQTHYPIHLDEVDKAFDHYHKQKLLDLLNTLVPDRIVEQLFMINHSVMMSSGVSNAEILVLNENNIILPEVYNQHVRIQRY